MATTHDVKTTQHSTTTVLGPEHYVKIFHSGSYPSKPIEKMFKYIKHRIHGIFAEGKYRGKYLLDIGSGPVVHPVITASQWFDEVYVSDISLENVNLLQKWLRGESEHMEHLMKEFSEMEGKGVSWQDKNSQVRKKIKQAVQWDMRKPAMLTGTPLQGIKFDVVTGCLCLGPASSSHDEYTKNIKGIGDMLSPGGRLILCEPLDVSWYMVGGSKFKVLGNTEESIRRAFQEANYEIEEFETFELDDNSDPLISDVKSVYSIIARKI